MQKAQAALLEVVENVSKVIVGKKEKISLILATWLAEGHVLLEDVPGTGKTLIAKSLSRSINLSMGRVQFTPDLLPSDITGSSIFDQKSNTFKFEKGPVFCCFFLADEINRATPRTQSALLECMGERQVTADGNTFEIDQLFFVMATQNPIEHHGTFPLPEAQLDRFSIKISLGYMQKEEELMMARERMHRDPIETIAPVLNRQQFIEIRQLLNKIKIPDSVYNYVSAIIEKTRNTKELEIGSSPRGTLTLLNLGRAMALMNGEDFVRPTYIYNLVKPVLSHRLILSQEARFSGNTTEKVLDSLIQSIKVPTS